jgi:D-3-phosphoglycerate dehydrogenase
MTKVLIAESIDVNVLAEISKNSPIEFVYKPDITPTELENEIAEYNGLIVRPKAVSEKVINNAPNLKLVIRGGAGVNSIALEACKQYGVIVENTPGLNSDATAEYTMLLMLELIRKKFVRESDDKTRLGNPGNPELYMAGELRGKKLGIVGLGNIGFRVACIAEAFGMEVMFFVRQIKKMPYDQTDNIEEFLKFGHDIISLHIPLTPETKHFFGDLAFNLMKQDTILINTARPQLVDFSALKHAIENGTISGFAIDGDYELVEPFVKMDVNKVGIITHHIADATFEAQANITKQALKQAIAYFEKGEIINRVA